MDQVELRAICLSAATKTANTPEQMVREAFAYELYIWRLYTSRTKDSTSSPTRGCLPLRQKQKRGGESMGLRYENLDDETRRFMVEEIEMDAKEDKLYLSPWLSQAGQGDWSEILIEVARAGSDDTLANHIRERGRLNTTAQRREPRGLGYTTYTVPHTAPMTMAEGEFNRFMCGPSAAEPLSKASYGWRSTGQSP